MFNRAFNYVSNSFSGAVETASVVTSNFTSFLGASAMPLFKGAVVIPTTVAAKTAIHATRYTYDTAIDLTKISYNLVKTSYKYYQDGSWDWEGGRWHSTKSANVEITYKLNNLNEEIGDSNVLSKFAEFVSNTWYTKDASHLGQVAAELEDGPFFAKLVVDSFCLVQSVLWDAVIVTTFEGALSTLHEAGIEGYKAAEANAEIQHNESLLDSMDSVDMISDLEDNSTTCFGLQICGEAASSSDSGSDSDF
ncbi:MAG: hypothetical protein P8P83_01960 [Rickettsiaceae bacterium]|nr:hypothetical protein [Rickettsiaceae bacterium]